MKTQHLCLSLLAILLCASASAQWVQTGGPYGGYIHRFAVAGPDIFTATDDGVYLSTNNGTSWMATRLTNTQVRAFAVISGSGGSGDFQVFAGTGDGEVYRTTNRGTTWLAVNNGLTTTGSFIASINALLVSGPNLFAGADNDVNGGVYLSTNNGANWTAVNNGLGRTSISCLASIGSTVFAGKEAFDWWGDGGVYRSTNNGSNWTRASAGLADSTGQPYTVTALAASGSLLFAATYGGVFVSTDNGSNWTPKNTGLIDQGGYVTGVYGFAVNGPSIFAMTWNGLYLSTNNGTSWATGGLMLPLDVQALAVSPNGAGGSNLFAGTSGVGIFLSTDNGTTWTEASTGLSRLPVQALLENDQGLFAGTTQGVYTSPDNGASWNLTNGGRWRIPVTTLVTCGTNLYAGYSRSGGG